MLPKYGRIRILFWQAEQFAALRLVVLDNVEF